MDEKEIRNLLSSLEIEFEENKNLKEITWIKRGGSALFFVKPNTLEKLKNLVVFLYKKKIPFDLIGASSNIYCKSTYNPNILITTQKCNTYTINDNEIECDCGVNTALLSKRCCELNISGFEGLTKLPGTIGGAVCNNASAFNCQLPKILTKIEFINSSGETQWLSAAQLSFEHRSSALKRKEMEGVISRCFFKRLSSDNNLISKAEFYSQIRKETQEGPKQNLGSCFTANKIRHLRMNDFSSVLTYFHYIFFVIWFHFIGKKSKSASKLYKEKLLKFLNYTDLSKYISDKNINCFIWRDEKADVLFNRYLDFMRKYNTSSKLEIEIRE